MGEPSPEVLEIKCSSCDTGFRLRLKTGRLPRHDIECPACGASIAVASLQDLLKPKAAVLRRTTELGRLPGGSADQSGDRLKTPDVPNRSQGTLLGLPVDDLFPGDIAPEKTFETTPTSVSGVPVGRTPLGFQELSESDVRNTTRHPWEAAKTSAKVSTMHIHEKKTDPTLASVDESGNMALPDLENSSSPRLEAENTGLRQTPVQGVESQPPKLNELLRKVREKRGTDAESLSTASAHRDTTREIRIPQAELQKESGQVSAHLAKIELAQAHIVKRKAVPPKPSVPIPVQSPLPPAGHASEKRGSGYIRLPTSEILEVIGTGEFRLKVDDIIYEPVDENGLVKLIKGGVLMGAELIAETDGDWMPVNQHPVMEKLRKRMADEVHSLLKDVTRSSDSPLTEDLTDFLAEESEPPPLPLLHAPEELNEESSEAVELVATPAHLTTHEETPLEETPLEETPLEETPPATPDEETPYATPLEETPQTATASQAPELTSTDTSLSDEELPGAPPKGPQKANSKLARAVGIMVILGVVAALGIHQWTSSQAKPTPPVEPQPEDVVAVAEPEKKDEPEPLVDKVAPVEPAGVRYRVQPSVELALEALADASTSTEEAFLLALAEFDRSGDPRISDALKSLQSKAFDLKADPSGFAAATEVVVDKVPVVEVTYKGHKALLIPDMNAAAEHFRKARAASVLCMVAECGFSTSFVLPVSLTHAEWQNAGLPTPNGKDPVQGLLVFDLAGAEIPLPAFQTLWRSWMRADDAVLDSPLKSAQPDLEKQIGAERTDALLNEAGKITIRDFARQLSAVMTFDYLTNNGSRFDTKDGNDLKLRNGLVISTRHLHTFQPRASTRIKGRFSWLARLDKNMVESMSVLERDAVSEKMFPDTTPAERAPLNVFWNQVDALKAKKDSAQFF